MEGVRIHVRDLHNIRCLDGKWQQREDVRRRCLNGERLRCLIDEQEEKVGVPRRVRAQGSFHCYDGERRWGKSLAEQSDGIASGACRCSNGASCGGIAVNADNLVNDGLYRCYGGASHGDGGRDNRSCAGAEMSVY